MWGCLGNIILFLGFGVLAFWLLHNKILLHDMCSLLLSPSSNGESGSEYVYFVEGSQFGSRNYPVCSLSLPPPLLHKSLVPQEV